jgi:hypothetical protein
MTRAQTGALAIVGFFVVLGGAMLLLWFLEPMYQPINNYAANASTNATAQRGLSYTQAMYEQKEFIITMISGLGLLVLVFYERGGR